MKEKINWKAVIITFLVTGFITTVLVAVLTGTVTWLITKNKYQAESKKEITKLRNQMMEMQEQLLDQNTSTSTGTSDNSSAQREWLQYENSRFAFQISYPSDYKIKESTNGDGVTISKDKSIILAYGQSDSSRNIRAFVNKNFPEAKNIENFSNNEAQGLKFNEDVGNEYYVFQNRLGDYIVIMSESPDNTTAALMGDIAFTFVPLSE